LKPVEIRTMQWHAWAKAAVGWDGTWWVARDLKWVGG
jgi:hypothetical protein